MSRSILLQLARDSIEEVLQAQNSIDKQPLLNQHPLLNEKIPTQTNIYIEDQLHSSHIHAEDSLLNNIIISAKKAAFEDKMSAPLTTGEYLHCEIELVLTTQDGVISERDPAIITE